VFEVQFFFRRIFEMKPDRYKQEISRRYKKKHDLVEKKHRKITQHESNAYRYEQEIVEEQEEQEQQDLDTIPQNTSNVVSIRDEFEFKKKEYFQSINSKEYKKNRNVGEVIWIPKDVLEAFNLGQFRSETIVTESKIPSSSSIGKVYPLKDNHSNTNEPQSQATHSLSTTTTITITSDPMANLDDLIDDIIS
jgi:hypothetical protein